MAWRRLASRTTHCDEETVRPVAEQHFGLQWDDALAEVVANAEDLLVSSRPAPVLAAEICRRRLSGPADAELLGFWLADMLLAQKFRWLIPVPLLMGQVSSTIFKSGENRKRIRPGAELAGCGVFSLCDSGGGGLRSRDGIGTTSRKTDGGGAKAPRQGIWRRHQAAAVG